MLTYLILILSIYGWAWVITKSKMTKSFRELLKTRALTIKKYDKSWTVYHYNTFFKLLNYTFNCIVCTSAWLCLIVIAFLTFFPQSRVATLFVNVPDTILILGSVISSSWIISTFTGDSD